MVFRSHYNRTLAQQPPCLFSRLALGKKDSIQQNILSKQIGLLWNAMSAEEKVPFVVEASRRKWEHLRLEAEHEARQARMVLSRKGPPPPPTIPPVPSMPLLYVPVAPNAMQGNVVGYVHYAFVNSCQTILSHPLPFPTPRSPRGPIYVSTIANAGCRTRTRSAPP